MGIYVYIIKSEKDKSYHKGFTIQHAKRIIQDNEGGSKYTSGKLPWIFVYLEELKTKREALIREKALKKYRHNQIEQLINSPKNQLLNILQYSVDKNACLSSPTLSGTGSS